MDEKSAESGQSRHAPVQHVDVITLVSSTKNQPLEFLLEEEDFVVGLENEPARAARDTARQIQIESIRDDKDLKKVYGRAIHWMIWLILGVNYLIIILSGFRFLGFSITQGTLITLMGQSLVQIVSLAIVVTKFLFNDKRIG